MTQISTTTTGNAHKSSPSAWPQAQPWVEVGCYVGALAAWVLLALFGNWFDLGFWPMAILAGLGVGLIVVGLLTERKRRVLAQREFSSYFFSPIAYVVMALFVFLSGLLFLLTTFAPGQPASLRNMFFWVVWILIPIVPAISMRLFAEELRSGTIEPLMTSPVSDMEVVIGKWLGAVGFFAAMLIPTLVFVILLALWSNPDYGPIFTEYLGLLLVGGLYAAIGTFASVLTRNQIIAFLLTIFIILLLTVVTYFVPPYLPAGWQEGVYYLNVNEQFADFNKGLIDTSNLVYFASTIAFFLLLAVKTLESRKWR